MERRPRIWYHLLHMAFDASREGQLDEDRLKWGYWWVNHQVQVRRAVSVALLVIDLVLVGYAGYGFADWFFLTGKRERAEAALQTKFFTDYAGFRARNAPQDLAAEGVTILGGTQGSFDLVTRITNPNLRWRVAFDYRFTYGGGQSETRTGYVLPGDTRWFSVLGIKGSRPGSASIQVENIRWQRVDLHETRPDFTAWARERLDVRVTELSFQPPLPQDPVAVGKAKFTVENATAYGYFNVGFSVALYSGTRLTGFNRVSIGELRAGARRALEASWFTDTPAATRVEVKPEIDIFDPRAYIPTSR